jgi:hypothetical protein
MDALLAGKRWLTFLLGMYIHTLKAVFKSIIYVNFENTLLFVCNSRS